MWSKLYTLYDKNNQEVVVALMDTQVITHNYAHKNQVYFLLRASLLLPLHALYYHDNDNDNFLHKKILTMSKLRELLIWKARSWTMPSFLDSH
jgi:hypothetical protein